MLLQVLNKSLVATVTVNGPSVGESSELSLPRSEEHLIDTKTAAVQLIDMFKVLLLRCFEEIFWFFFYGLIHGLYG